MGQAARWLCEMASGADRIDDVLDERSTERMVAQLDAMVARYASGEPLQYVLGRWAFRHLDLLVDRRVLIPRRRRRWSPKWRSSAPAGWPPCHRRRPGHRIRCDRTVDGRRAADHRRDGVAHRRRSRRHSTSPGRTWPASDERAPTSGWLKVRGTMPCPAVRAPRRRGRQPAVHRRAATRGRAAVRDWEPPSRCSPGPTVSTPSAASSPRRRRGCSRVGGSCSRSAPTRAGGGRRCSATHGYCDVGIRPDLAGRDPASRSAARIPSRTATAISLSRVPSRA